MKFFSTKEIAQKWGISPRRVSILAAQGRIEGAQLIANHWLIPEDAAKPVDTRCRKAAPAPSAEQYIFPFPLYCVSSAEQIERFTGEERKLYQLCLSFESGDFEKAKSAAEKLLTAANCYVRIGALYFLSLVSMYLQNFEATEKYAILFRTACMEAPAHTAELEVLLREFDSELISVTAFSKEVDFSDIDAFPDDHLAMISDFKLLSELVKMSMGEPVPDIASYEILCRQVERQNYFYCAMLMHYNLSMYYAFAQNKSKELQHIRQAINIGLEHGTVFTLAYSVFLNPDMASEILSEYPSEVVERFSHLAKFYGDARDAYAEYCGGETTLPQYSEEDTMLILCCFKNDSIEEMAEKFGLSPSGIKKRLSALYSKMGVKSKNDMIRKYVRSVMDIEKV